MKVLIATDGTESSAGTTGAVKDLHLTAEDEIIIATVIDMALPASIEHYAGAVPSIEQIEIDARNNAEAAASSAESLLRAALGDIQPRISRHILFGTPDRRIIELATHEKADMIIVGSHGYNRLERLLLGSVSDAIVHQAPCSVLVVRQPE